MASAMTSAFCSFAMEPGDSTERNPVRSGPHRTEAGVDRLPVQGVEPGRHVVRTLVLVLEVVSVLPYIHAENRRQLVHEGAVLVGIALDGELALPVGDEPRPAAAELADRGFLQLLLEGVVTAECVLDRVGDATIRVAAAAGTHDRPEDRVVGVSAGVVADHGPDVLGDLLDPPEKFLDSPLRELWVLLERGIRVRHIRGVVLVVMDLHGLRVDVRLEGIERVWKLGKLKSHDRGPPFLNWVCIKETSLSAGRFRALSFDRGGPPLDLGRVAKV